MRSLKAIEEGAKKAIKYMGMPRGELRNLLADIPEMVEALTAAEDTLKKISILEPQNNSRRSMVLCIAQMNQWATQALITKGEQ